MIRIQSPAITMLFVLVSYILGTVFARTTEQVTRSIAIAGLVIAGVTFLLACLMCLAGAGVSVFRMLQGRDGNDGRGDRGDGNKGDASTGTGTGVRSGNTL